MEKSFGEFLLKLRKEKGWTIKNRESGFICFGEMDFLA